jgi:hypothetical protein
VILTDWRVPRSAAARKARAILTLGALDERVPFSPRLAGRMAAVALKRPQGGQLQGLAVRACGEIERTGGRYPLVSNNVELRVDGQIRRDRGEPAVVTSPSISS